MELKGKTYFLAVFKVGQVIVSIIAEDMESAFEKLKLLFPGCESYALGSVTEYFLPGVGFEQLAKSMEKMSELKDAG